jgi:hydrogenase expression/formation protein HypD
MMKYISEFQDGNLVHGLIKRINQRLSHPWTIMEVCGGQTHTLIGEGIDQLLPSKITMVHGPGCPVCVTSVEMIDTAIALARLPTVILCSYGDMVRVPGTREDLLSVKAQGSDVRIVYSSLDALQIARDNPRKQVVFFAIGFETTTPPNAMAVTAAAAEQIDNFFLLVSQVLVPPALHAILSAQDAHIQGLLAPGHVCTVVGYEAYEPIAKQYRIPIVVTGFEPVDLVEGILLLVEALEAKNYTVINQYTRSVPRQGNLVARHLINEVFEPIDQSWRGIGVIPQSGLGLRSGFKRFDARRLLGKTKITSRESPHCQAGSILIGKIKPNQCPAFGVLCTPDHPLGAPMVSSEGACAAYYHSGIQRNQA